MTRPFFGRLVHQKFRRKPATTKKKFRRKISRWGCGETTWEGRRATKPRVMGGFCCFTCWTRNRVCTAAAERASGRTPPWKVLPIRASQSVPAGARQALATRIRIRILLPRLANHASFQPGSLSTLKQNSADDRNRDVSSINQNLWCGGVHFNRGKTGTGPTNPLQQQ